jgi:hypothetical protein
MLLQNGIVDESIIEVLAHYGANDLSAVKTTHHVHKTSLHVMFFKPDPKKNENSMSRK